MSHTLPTAAVAAIGQLEPSAYAIRQIGCNPSHTV
jgi:hypothetical protein